VSVDLWSFRSVPADRWGEAYERLVLDVLGVTAVPTDRWAEVYAETSRGLTSERDEALTASASGLWGDSDHRAVAALVFGQRTFLTMMPILTAYPLPPGPVFDLGSGSGAAALAATICGASDVTLVDVSAEALGLGRALLGRMGVAATVHAQDLRAYRPRGGSVLAAHCLNELEGQTRASQLVGEWLGGGVERVVLVEPGTHEGGRGVQRIRDSVAARHAVLGPCTHGSPCPLESRPRDWCHFEQPAGLGPVATSLLRLTGRRVDRRAFSWLVVDTARARGRVEAEARLLSVRDLGKGKLGATVCTSGGLRTLTELTRGQAAPVLAGLESGNVVRLAEDLLVRRGDGERVLSPEAVKRSRTL
jgi:hypothetical protein